MDSKAKPVVELACENGNVFNLLGICARALKRVGQNEEAAELQKRVLGCSSYDDALRIMLEYVDETGGDDSEDFDDDDGE